MVEATAGATATTAMAVEAMAAHLCDYDSQAAGQVAAVEVWCGDSMSGPNCDRASCGVWSPDPASRKAREC